MEKYLFIFCLILSFNNYALSQEDRTKCDKKILGQWQVYMVRSSYNQQDETSSNDIWFFRTPEIVSVSNEEMNYQLTDDCKKLFLSNKEFNFFIFRFTRDTLTLKSKILPHESLIIYLKKIK